MHRRCLEITVLTAALLFGQGGYFLVAALCPHLLSEMASCETNPSAAPRSHEDMGHMAHMEREHEPVSQPNSSALAMGQPIGDCSHCAVHSRKTPTAASLRETEAAKRSIDVNIPLNVSEVTPAMVSPVAVLTSRAHGPPGEEIPRYVLINIFRI